MQKKGFQVTQIRIKKGCESFVTSTTPNNNQDEKTRLFGNWGKTGL